MVWTKEWLLNKIEDYQKLDFFEQYNHLSNNELANMIIETNDKYYQWHDFLNPISQSSNDWQFLTMMDRKRLLHVATDNIYGNFPGSYTSGGFACTLSDLANISRNIFCPQNITDISQVG